MILSIAKKKKVGILVALSLFLSIFLGYLFIYPNDFFLPDHLFKKAKDYQVQRSFFSYKIYYSPEKTRDLENLVEHLDDALKEEAGWFKNNVKRTVSIIQQGDSEFFVKRYNCKNFIDYCSKCPFRSSKAFRSFYYAYLFKQNNLPTPEPIALVEKRIGFLWTTCYLISKKLEGKSLEDLDREPLNSVQEKSVQKQLDDLLTQLHENQWVHRDLTLRNIFLSKGKLYFLDLDDLHSYAFKNYFFEKKFFQKHQKRLNHSFKNSKIFHSISFFIPEKQKMVKLSIKSD